MDEIYYHHLENEIPVIPLGFSLIFFLTQLLKHIPFL